MTLSITDEDVPAQRSLRSRFAWLWPVSGATNEIAALDGLRGIAVLLTIGFHLVQSIMQMSWLSPTQLGVFHATEGVWEIGATGVELFFVLSGFLLFLPYARALCGLQGFPSTQKFYIRRALRILPAYWVSLALILLLFDRAALQPSKAYDIIMHVFLVHNWSSKTYQSINVPYWTMAIESQFYVALPILAGIIMQRVKRGQRTRAWMIMASLGGASIVCAVAQATIGYRFPQMWGVLQPLNYFIVFLAGMAVSFLFVYVREGQGQKYQPVVQKVARIAGVGAIGVFALYTAMRGFLYTESTTFTAAFSNSILGGVFSGIVLCTVFGWQSWARVFSLPALRFVGIIAYSLYIWNIIFYTFVMSPMLQQWQSTGAILALDILGGFFLLIPFCFGFYTLVERPFIRARRRQH